MDEEIKARPIPLPYPESPSVAEWLAAHAPQQVQTTYQHEGAQPCRN